MKRYDRILQESLIKNNVLSDTETKLYFSESRKEDVSLKNYLLTNSIVSEKQIMVALSQTLGIDYVNLSKLDIDPAVVQKVPIKFVWYYKVMPIKFEGEVLVIAVSNPLDVRDQDEIRVHLGMSIRICLCEEKLLLEAIKKSYGLASETVDKIMAKDLQSNNQTAKRKEDVVEDLEHETEDPTVSNLVNQIILEAYKRRATDIHIEPYRDQVRFRYRIDGVLIDANLPEHTRHFLPSILSRIKILANLSITEKRIPQDGSAVVKTKDQQLDLRVSTIPTPRGESIVIRILPSKVMLFSLEKLGFNKRSVEQFRQLIKKPHGVIFITGPTGSGKTTSLYACLNEINSAEKKIITIEDPVEYEMKGITQVQVNPKVKFDFSTGLRSLLRHDPDIIMVGEVRDLETAEITIRTALTGHLVFSTLHTNDSASGVTRLIDMGVEPYLVASSVEAFVAQRLVRVICPKCKVEETEVLPGVQEEIARSLQWEDDIQSIKLYKGKGCDHCNQTGFYGRMAIYEILLMDDHIKAAVLKKPRSEYIKKIAIKNKMRTLRQNGWQAVLDGLTTYDEVLNVTVKDDILADDPEVESETTKEISYEEKESDQIVRRIVKREDWIENNDYDARVHRRAFKELEVRYRLAKRDPQEPETLLSEGVEYTSKTIDLSAGGVRFVSKVLLSIGTILDMRVHFPSPSSTVSCLAKVCRVEEDCLSNMYTIVAYYLDMTTSDRSAVVKFIEQVNSSSHLKTLDK